MEWQSLWDTHIQPLLKSNQFLQGGFILMLIGGLAAWARHVPKRIWDWVMHRLFMEIEIQMADEAYWWVYDWLATQPYSRKWSRCMSVRSTRRKGETANNYSDPDDYDYNPRYGVQQNAPEIILTPAPGLHWLFWKRRFVIVNRVREEGKADKSQSIELEKERFIINMLTQSRAKLMEMLLEARTLAYPPGDTRITVQTPGRHASWAVDKRYPRPPDSIVLKGTMLQDLSEDMRHFLENRDWYLKRGIPYRRGYLLHGPPGNGKSSTVLGLASALDMTICVINLGNAFMGDDELGTMMRSVPDRSLILLEDVDCVFEKREGSKDKDNKLTFSGVLNAIDGVAAPEGHILVMTTNHVEKLDAALIRPGRCDVKLLFANAVPEQAERLFLRFFPEEPDKARQFADKLMPGVHNMATIQGHMILHAHDAQAALDSWQPDLIETEEEESDETQVRHSA